MVGFKKIAFHPIIVIVALTKEHKCGADSSVEIASNSISVG